VKPAFSLWNIRAGKGLLSSDVCSSHANNFKNFRKYVNIFIDIVSVRKRLCGHYIKVLQLLIPSSTMKFTDFKNLHFGQ